MIRAVAAAAMLLACSGQEPLITYAGSDMDQRQASGCGPQGPPWASHSERRDVPLTSSGPTDCATDALGTE